MWKNQRQPSRTGTAGEGEKLRNPIPDSRILLEKKNHSTGQNAEGGIKIHQTGKKKKKKSTEGGDSLGDPQNSHGKTWDIPDFPSNFGETRTKFSMSLN